MRVLLDTNIIIHRENKRVSNYSIGHLYRWLDKLKYDKIIHPYSIDEIKKYKDPETQQAIAVKLESYEVIKTIKEPDVSFLNLIGIPEKSENDKIDDSLLYEVYSGRVDILITEDRKLRKKAEKIGLKDKVYSINSFITIVTAENPSLIEYKMLAVEKTYFGNVDINDNFFDSFRNSYPEFDKWFARKCDEEAYICNTDEGKILGFLYLKTEGFGENYSDITPPFKPMRRLKVGTFKVESTGFRLGERFIKIIFDNALQRNVDEIYVTLYTDREELTALASLLQRWGFIRHGVKKGNNKDEYVLIKKMKDFIPKFSCRKNFPNIRYNCNKFILPIFPQYHTTLLPDSKLNNENKIDFLGREPHRYALQKVYISWAPGNGVKSGDLILFYRTGGEGSIKKYSSVVTTVAMVDEIIDNICSETELLSLCQNRSVFSTDELKSFWANHRFNLKIIKFIFVKSLTKKLTLGYLWEHNIVSPPGGPRSFTKITDSQYEQIMQDSKTEIKYIENVEDTILKAILLSIKPEYVEKILGGQKKYEYRKRLAKTESSIILIYSTSPIMKVVAKVEVVDTICAAPSTLWEKTKRNAGISRRKYREYFHGCKKAYAYQLGEIQIFDIPKSLSEFNISLAPQSFAYVELEQ